MLCPCCSLIGRQAMPRNKVVQPDTAPADVHSSKAISMPSWATATVINLTEQMVREEAEAMLVSCGSYAYQELFSLPSERERLIHYATNRVRNIYMVVSDPAEVERHYARAMVQKPAIQAALQEGIKVIADIYLQDICQPPKPIQLMPVSQPADQLSQTGR
jgi:hypothetical protein